MSRFEANRARLLDSRDWPMAFGSKVLGRFIVRPRVFFAVVFELPSSCIALAHGGAAHRRGRGRASRARRHAHPEVNLQEVKVVTRSCSCHIDLVTDALQESPWLTCDAQTFFQ